MMTAATTSISLEEDLVTMDPALYKAWWKLRQVGTLENSLQINESDKKDFLKNLYNNLYNELRDKHKEQQQVVAWGFTILSGGGFIVLSFLDNISPLSAIAFSISLGFLTFILSRTLRFLAEDRMSIARQLDRIHQILGVFTKDFYYNGATLFDPIWQGWGFDEKRDVNANLVRLYQYVLWIVWAIDAIILMNKAGIVRFI